MISFTIPGKPKALKRHRVARNGRMYDPSYQDKRDMWVKMAQYNRSLPMAREVKLKILFVMPRPRHHFRSGKYSHLLNNKSKDIIYHSIKPDLDNLVKMVADVIQGRDRMIADDSQICMLQAEKVYGKPRTEVIIEELS